MAVNRNRSPMGSHKTRLENIGTMASGIAHEINTPIQFIGDNLQFIGDSFETIEDLLKRLAILRKDANGDSSLKADAIDIAEAVENAELDFLLEELPRAIEQSLSGVQQVARIVSAMNSFMHPGGTQTEMADINQAIDMTATICRNEWKYDADLELSLDPGLPKINCHIGELSQVWLNLIVNAAHAIKAKPDLPRGLIRIKTSVREGMVEVTVTDNGTGMPEAVRTRIFEPFFSTKIAGEGSGQGLAISHEIITVQHGGEIDLWTRLDEGTRFTVRLPIESHQSSTTSSKEAFV